MHTLVLALNWQVWGRHRWGLAAAFSVVAAICVIPHAYPPDRLTGDVGGSNVPFLMMLLLPLVFVVLYLAYAFSLSEFGSHVTTSGFPNWMLTLPVRSSNLVFWPMISSAIAVAVIWIAVAWFAINKAGLEVPLFWPAAGLACSMIWIQAVDWSPLSSVSKALAAAAVLAVLWIGLMNERSQAVAFALTPAVMVLGFVAGAVGVNRLRRGERLPTISVPALPWRAETDRRFTSPQQSQRWLEWRRNASPPILLALGWVLLATLIELVDGGNGDLTAFESMTIVASLLLAPIAGLILGKPEVWSRQVRLTTLSATRPLTCGDMLMAKFRMTAGSIFAAWLIIALAWTVSQAAGMHSSKLNSLLNWMPFQQYPARFSVTITALFIGIFGYLFFLIAGNFFVGLTGRSWMILAALFIYFGVIPNLMAMDVLKVFKVKLAEAAMMAIALKLVLAGWAFYFAHRRGLISGRAIAVLTASWLLTVGAAMAAFMLTHPANDPRLSTLEPEQFRTGYLTEMRNTAIALALFCPLVRIALAPLALGWNRHR